MCERQFGQRGDAVRHPVRGEPFEIGRRLREIPCRERNAQREDAAGDPRVQGQPDHVGRAEPGDARAEQLGVAEEPVKDFLNRDVHDTSPRIAYARAALMGTCNPNELTQRQLTFVAYLLERWSAKLEVARAPGTLTDCNCSICRRYGALWAYYAASSVKIEAPKGGLSKYSWNRKIRAYYRCKKCGCVTHYAYRKNRLIRRLR